MEVRLVVNLVVYNIAKIVNWISLMSYLFIIAFWIYQFLKKEQMVHLLNQLNAIIANKSVQSIASKLSKNMNIISIYGWFEFILMLSVIVIGFTLKFRNGFDIGVIINDIIFLILGLVDSLFYRFCVRVNM